MSFELRASFVAVVLAFGGARCAEAATDPRLVIHHDLWTSSTGRCTVDIEHASVAGVPSGVKRRIDGILAKQMMDLSLTPETSSRREAACTKETKERIAVDKRDSYHGFEHADWTTGLARGRWLSVRFHYSEYSGAFQVHPADYYRSTTFDLAHGGYPVPTIGFYVKAQRAHLADALTRAEIASLNAAVDREAVHQLVSGALIDDPDIIVTLDGIEVTGLGGDEATRNLIVKVPYSQLTGVGTPDGPLDPATR